MENLLFQDDFSACNLSFPPNYFFWPEFEDVLRRWFLTIFFIFVMQLNLRLVLRFDPILSTQMQTILSSLFFQKIRLSELKLAISFKESNRTCLEHSRTFLDLQICPHDRNWDWAIVTWLPCQFFFICTVADLGEGPGGPGPTLFLDQIDLFTDTAAILN